ncbi:MAG: cell division protein FtsZ, partial [Bacteroidia bacterium]|nr:cell division protein FtsZ [Bacteroidia bacterium]NNM15766.1 cell division protein FtsZ [Bacteroidia bacterium]
TVDTLLVICNDKLREIHGDLKLTEAFGHADDILSTAARSIAEIITVTGYINVDFADVYTVMNSSGVAIMGSATAEGDDRALTAAKRSLDSPLLNDNKIVGARYILLNISSGAQEITMDEIGEITDFIQNEAGQTADIIMGTGLDESLDDNICVTVIATRFQAHEQNSIGEKEPERIVRNLDDDIDDKKEEAIQTVSAVEPTKEEPVVMELKQEEPETEEPDLTPELIFDMPEKTEIEQPTTANEEEFKYFDLNEDYSDNLDESQKVEDSVTEETTLLKTEESIDLEITNLDNKSKSGEIDFPVEDQYKRSRERIQKLKEISYRLNQPGGLNDLEKEPAYKRRNVELNNVPAANENEVSRHTLSEDEEKNASIKKNNSFLHDKVD